MKTTALMFIFLSVIYCNGYCQIINVPDDQPTIQAAINAADNGDTVLVKGGTYYETIDFSGKDITVGSYFINSGDTSAINQTIIDADSLGPAVVFQANETQAARLIGFTLTHGSGELVDGLKYGGAIFCSGASPTLDYLYITENEAVGLGSGCGGGAFFVNSQAILKNSIVMNNNAYYGGGIRCNLSSITVENTVIKDNFSISGGGIMFRECPSSFISKCIFTGNQAIYGGAICCSISSPVINKTTCFKNSGLYGGSLNIGVDSDPRLINSICWNNSMHSGTVCEIYLAEGGNSILAAYNDIQGGQDSIDDEAYGMVYWLEGNINVYPEFTDSFNADVHLNPNSPCINSGTAIFINGTDTLSNIQDYYGTAPDMGAYEFQEPNGIYPLPAESLGNSVIVIKDTQTGENSIILTVTNAELLDISVLDMLGRTVEVITHRVYGPGVYALEIPATKLRKGAYLLRLSSLRVSQAVKIFSF